MGSPSITADSLPGTLALMDRPSRLPLYVGILVIVAGWVTLFVAWYQAGRQELETGQIPYVLSGGFGALGLLAMGGMAVLIDLARQAEWRAMQHLDDLRQALEGVARAVERPTRGAPAASQERTTARRRSRRRRSGSRGRAQDASE